eukprot:scaffold676355_cov73-Prasinocladus_malaysianus.AAC.1
MLHLKYDAIAHILQFSGPVAVAVMGLYGAAFSRFEVTPRLVTSGIYDHFWETVCFCLNGVVFFYSGVATVNFFLRSFEALSLSSGGYEITFWTFGMLPVLYLLNFAARGTCISFFSWALRLKRSGDPESWGPLPAIHTYAVPAFDKY